MACWKDADLQLGTILARIFRSSPRTHMCRSAPGRTLDPPQISGMELKLLMANLPWPCFCKSAASMALRRHSREDKRTVGEAQTEQCCHVCSHIGIAQRFSVMIFSWFFFVFFKIGFQEGFQALMRLPHLCSGHR